METISTDNGIEYDFETDKNDFVCEGELEI